jgi:hypothetical protein
MLPGASTQDCRQARRLTYPGVIKRLRQLSLLMAILLGTGTLVSVIVPFARPRLIVSHELFDRQLQHVSTIDGAVEHVREIAGPSPNQAQVASAADTFVRERFADGYSQFRFNQNWLAYLSGYVWDDLRVPVLPEEILDYRRGACSQQAIVFQAILARFGIEYASVIFPGHYASGARVGDQWFYFDPHLEANQTRLRPLSALRTPEGAKALYGERPQYAWIRSIAGKARLADINRFPAPQAAIFQTATAFFSKFGWLVFLLLWGAMGLPILRRDDREARPPPGTS